MRNRIHKKGMFVDSTTLYGPMVDKFDGLEVLHPANEVVETNVIHMTRTQYDSYLLSRSIINRIEYRFPNISLGKRSKIYNLIRKELYNLLSKKAMREHGLSLRVA